MVYENSDTIRADAARLLADARRAGRLPRNPSAESLSRIASLLRETAPGSTWRLIGQNSKRQQPGP